MPSGLEVPFYSLTFFFYFIHSISAKSMDCSRNDNNFPVQYVVIRDLVQSFIALFRPNRHISKEQGMFGLATRQGDGRMYTGQWVKNRMHGTGHPGRFGGNKEMVIICRRFLVCANLSQDVK